MRRFGAGDFPLGTIARRDDVVDWLIKRRSENIAKILNFGAPITVPRANLARKKAKPPKAGGKRRRWKKDRAVIAFSVRVYRRSIDELRHLTANALGFNFGGPTQQRASQDRLLEKDIAMTERS